MLSLYSYGNMILINVNTQLDDVPVIVRAIDMNALIYFEY